MLNNTGIVKETGLAPVQILANVEMQAAVSVVVGNTGLTADANGKKILKAGTPISGNLEARNTAFVKATTTKGSDGAADTSNAVGILLHDVDVTAGNNNGSCLIFGFVNLSRLDATTAALIDTATKTALNMIKFIKD